MIRGRERYQRYSHEPPVGISSYLWFIACIVVTALGAYHAGSRISEVRNNRMLRSVGIERIDAISLTVDGNVVSNWNEIVWTLEDKGKLEEANEWK